MATVCRRRHPALAAGMPDKASDPLLDRLSKTLEKDVEQRETMIKKIKVVFGAWAVAHAVGGSSVCVCCCGRK